MTDKLRHPLTVNGEPRAFFGRRSGKRLHKGQDRLFRDKLPALEIKLPSGPLDPRTLFQMPAMRLELEIGYGGGEHLARLARSHRDTGFVGCEVFSGGVAKMLEAIDDNGLTKTQAFVVLKPGVAPTEAMASELKAFVKSRLAPHKYPRELVFVDDLPKTATGKVQRFKLRELL